MNSKSTEQAYRVLARKYRPQTFEGLIGQDAMVRTLTNSFATGRIAQAWMLTGVRGIGKTTTARLIARALNYAVPGSDSGPSIAMDQMGEHCQAILESRHIDVIEMDAASRTGIEDVREIIESVRYKPVSARYKVYIIDEVHMLSRAAFNALLKTLEEPPPHVKFIFATTELRKVPVTVLSRCQRFDLRRLDMAMLIEHYRKIAGLESVAIDDEALALIARASEGSVRDGLSLLDQAIAYCGGAVTSKDVREMIGLADQNRIIDLFEAVMKGDAPDALKQLKDQYDAGGDPLTVLADLARFVHWVTRLKAAPDSRNDAARSQSERERGAQLAAALSMAALTRAWQMLLKGQHEAGLAGNALMAVEMVLIRLAYAAGLPPPAQLVASLKDAPEKSTGQASSGSAASPPAGSASQQRPPADNEPPAGPGPAQALARSVPPDARPADDDTSSGRAQPANLPDFAAIVAFAGARRDIRLKGDLERYVCPIRVSPGQLEMSLKPDAPSGLAGELSRKLEAWTGRRWLISVAQSGGERPLAEQTRDAKATLFRQARQLPAVSAVLEQFPGADIIGVKDATIADDNQLPPVPDAGDDD